MNTHWRFYLPRWEVIQYWN